MGGNHISICVEIAVDYMDKKIVKKVFMTCIQPREVCALLVRFPLMNKHKIAGETPAICNENDA